MTEYPNQFESKFGRGKWFHRTISVTTPSGETCDITGNTLLRITGQFEYADQKCTFDGETLFSGDSPIATYRYSNGFVFGGNSFALSDPNGEYLFSLRHSTGWSGKLFISRRDAVFGEITHSMLGHRFVANTSDELRPEIVLGSTFPIWIRFRGTNLF